MDNLVSIMIIFAQRMCRHLSNNGKSRDTGTNLSSNLMTRLMLKIKNGFSGERSLVLPKMVTDMMKADPIASILYVTDIGYYPKAENHYRERKEPIGQYVFIYCIDGFGSYDVNGKHYEYHLTNTSYFLPGNHTRIRLTPRSHGPYTGYTFPAAWPNITQPTQWLRYQ